MCSAVLPVSSVFSNLIFSSRRSGKSIDEFSDNNPYTGVMNMGVAGAQGFKIAKDVGMLTNNSNNKMTSIFNNIENGVKSAAKSSKAVGSTISALDVIASHNYINPLIYATGAVKVASSDNKLEDGITEASALTFMRLSEEGTKKFVGTPIYEEVSGIKHYIERDGGYKKTPFINTVFKSLGAKCNGKYTKFIPPIGKGAALGTMSILGYAGGHSVGQEVASAVVKKDNANSNNNKLNSSTEYKCAA